MDWGGTEMVRGGTKMNHGGAEMDQSGREMTGVEQRWMEAE